MILLIVLSLLDNVIELVIIILLIIELWMFLVVLFESIGWVVYVNICLVLCFLRVVVVLYNVLLVLIMLLMMI